MRRLVTGNAVLIDTAIIRHAINKTTEHVVNVDKLTPTGTHELLVYFSENRNYAFE